MIIDRKSIRTLNPTFMIVIFVLSCSFFGLFGINSNNAYADYTISMTSSGAQSIDVSAGGNGTAISADNITVTTNCRAGYNFSMATSVSNNNLYLNGDISNNTSGTYFSPVDGTSALSSNNNKNKWGYYYNSSTPTTAPNASSIFSAVPVISSPATIVSPISSATDINDSFNIYYGVAVSSNLIPGTYKMIPDTNNSNNDGTIIYYLTLAEACMPYLVQFNPTSTAGGTTLSGTGTMGSQTIPAGTPTNLNANTFTAPNGYEFDGWNTAQDGTGTSYTDGQSVTDLTTGGGSITLYAQWKKKPTFQTATMADCGKTMTDDRGVTAYRNVAYTTAMIGDLCWMTRNLDLPGGTALTNADTNLTTKSSYTLPNSSTSGFSDSGTAYVYNSDSTNFNDTSCGSNNPCYSYYSWNAAIAGDNPSSGTASNDICPKGWRLPTQAELTRLIFTYSYNTGAKLVAAPFLGVYAGYYLNSSFNYGGSYGRYWSSTANTASYAYRMYFNSSSANWDGNPKYYGFSVRCVMKNYMQDQTPSSLAAIMPNEGDTAILIDKRDEHEYSVAKIGSLYWMTKNLDLPGGTTIYKTDSNITADSYTLPTSSTSGFSTASTAYVYNSGRTDCSSPGCYSYYSYAAATAGTNPSSDAASSDICPKGWRLPTRAELNTLIGTYTTGATLTASPFLGVYNGSYNYSGFYNGGSAGYYWSSTAINDNFAYYFYFPSGTAGVYSMDKYYGNSVRCVAQS